MEDHSKHFVGKVAQKAIIAKDGKVLLARCPTDTKWDLPGGRIHTGEKPKEAVAREVLEELGVDVKVGVPVFAGMTKADSTGEERYFVAFEALLSDPEQTFTLQKDEVAEIYWVSKEEIETIALFEICRDAVHTYFNKV